MNFEFLQGLKGLGDVYEPCKDAEELVRSKPYLSIAASRKSAEMLAKFIYMASHYQGMQGLTFVDVLNDQAVKRFFPDREVINVFHHIRKSGNQAVHGEANQETENDAFEVLQSLHFVAGETAKRLRLVRSYPEFNSDIGYYPDASYDEEAAITEKAEEMFLAYVIAERDKYRVRLDLNNDAHREYFSKGIAIMHEYLEFDHPVNLKPTVDHIKEYLGYIIALAIKPDDNSESEDEALWNRLYLGIVLRVDDKTYQFHKDYLSNNDIPEEFYNGLKEMSSAGSFSVDIHADGNLRGFYLISCDSETGEFLQTIDEESPWIGRGLSDYLESIRRRENFTYKGMFVYNAYNYDSEIHYIKNGKIYDVEDIASPDILNEQNGSEWTGSSIILVANCDYDEHPELIETLHETVRAFVPANQLPYIEDVWDEGEYGVLLNGTDWIVNDLQVVQDFLDKVNLILEPVADECDYFIEHCWYNLDEFEVAYIQLIDGKLMISGKRL